MRDPYGDGCQSLLFDFCDHLLSRYFCPQQESPETIGAAFAEYFSLRAPMTLDEVKDLAFAIGAGYPEPRKTPDNHRGFHVGAHGTYRIFYKKDDWSGGIRQTVMHEIWEIIEGELDDRCVVQEPVNGDKEKRAELFAVSVLMPRGTFREDCVRTHFDPLLLHDKYDQSHVSIMKRMLEVLGQEMPFIGLIYEHQPRKQYYSAGRPEEPMFLLGDYFEDPQNYILTRQVLSGDVLRHPDRSSFLPINGDCIVEPGVTNELARRVLSLEDSVRHIDLVFNQGVFSLGGYPVFTSRSQQLKTILIVGVATGSTPTLRESVRTSNGFSRIDSSCLPDSASPFRFKNRQ